MIKSIKNSFNRLEAYCRENEFKGWDPYDGLNSKIFSALPISKLRIFRLLWIQFFKQSPLNFRKFFRVEKDYNPQGLALFISGYCNIYQISPTEENKVRIKDLCEKLLDLRSDGWSGSAWGYNFDWQARAFFQPKYAPTVVATTFACYALLDAYEILRDKNYLNAAISSCEFILNDLNRSDEEECGFAFSYSPLDKTIVFNATLLGSRALSRVYSYTKDKRLIEAARKSVMFSCSNQNSDGSWYYGTQPFHKWIDNFHTGYNLECINEYQKYSDDYSFQNNLDIGLEFYLNNFFSEEGASKYYNNSTYPIDINGPAQLVVTLFRLQKIDKNRELLDRVLNWTIDNMQEKKGFFIYQMKRGISSKIPYMRWAQAWMFNAFTFYLLKYDNS